jgi:hypothetical protein
MAKQFQRRRLFRNRPIRNKNCMWWPCLLTDRDKMSTLHRGHSIDASYSSLKSAHFVMIHYQTWPPQAILISDWPIFFKSSPLKPLGQMNRNLVGSIYGMSSTKIAYLPSIDASYQVPVHLAEGFQRRRLKCEK